MILGDQKRLEVQPYTRFRIVDPLRFYQALRTLDQARAQLAQLVSSSVRRELGQVAAADAADAAAQRHRRPDQERGRGQGASARRRNRRSALPSRRPAVRNQPGDLRPHEVGAAARGQGAARARRRVGAADPVAAPTATAPSCSRRRSAPPRSAAAKATRRPTALLAEAFDKDPRFYQFYRALQTYRSALADSGPTLVLSPDADFLRTDESGPKRRKAADPAGAGERAVSARRAARGPPPGREAWTSRRRRLARHPAADLRRRPAARRRQRAADRGRLQRPPPAGRAPRGVIGAGGAIVLRLLLATSPLRCSACRWSS